MSVASICWVHNVQGMSTPGQGDKSTASGRPRPPLETDELEGGRDREQQHQQQQQQGHPAGPEPRKQAVMDGSRVQGENAGKAEGKAKGEQQNWEQMAASISGCRMVTAARIEHSATRIEQQSQEQIVASIFRE